jgi:two-component system response regulator HydG
MASSREKECILVVDDAARTLEVISRNLLSEGYKVFTAKAVPEAVRLLDSTPVDLVITDLKMPKVSGLDLVRHVRENFKDTEVMMVTGFATIEGAVNAVKTGAEEYLAKPFTDEELLAAVGRALEKLRLRRAGQVSSHRTPEAPMGILGQSKAMLMTFDAISKAAGTNATVLISGESGTGKELVARAIHYDGARAKAPFVPVNCGGIPETLLESELFGHLKGAFTGATASRAGFFQAADGGTIFLDEVSDTSLAMQVKLLRVLEDNEVFMVGSTKPRKVDVRILAATNKDLGALVGKSAFRQDLYYRLNVISITIAPLRERGNDILLLARHFASKFAEEGGKPTPEFSDRALRVLKSYEWPGNVRELKNVVKRLVVMSDENLIDVPDLPHLMRFSALRDTGLSRTLAEVEAEHVRNVLVSVEGNKTRAAEILGIDRKTLRQKLKDMSDRRDSPQ